MAYAQKPTLNDHAGISRRARGLNFGQSLHLHPYFAYVSSEASGKCAGSAERWLFDHAI